MPPHGSSTYLLCACNPPTEVPPSTHLLAPCPRRSGCRSAAPPQRCPPLPPRCSAGRRQRDLEAPAARTPGSAQPAVAGRRDAELSMSGHRFPRRCAWLAPPQTPPAHLQRPRSAACRRRLRVQLHQQAVHRRLLPGRGQGAMSLEQPPTLLLGLPSSARPDPPPSRTCAAWNTSHCPSAHASWCCGAIWWAASCRQPGKGGVWAADRHEQAPQKRRVS